MPLHESQVPDTLRARRFTGEAEAMPLVEWLNNTKDAKARTTVLKLHSLLRELLKTANSQGNPSPHDPKTTWNRLRRQINTILLRYPVCEHVIWFRPGFFMTGHIPLAGRRIAKNNLLTETGAVFQLLAVFRKTQNSWRLAQCDCGKYYFRRFRHQRFCSEVCRTQKFRSSEKWKAYRRDKAREYYWLHKKKNTK